VDEIVLPAALTDVQGALVPALRCLPLGCRIRSEADFHEDVFRAVPVAAVTPEWMLSRGWDASDHVGEAVKRLSDAVLALTLLVLSAPLQLLVRSPSARAPTGPCSSCRRASAATAAVPHAEVPDHAHGRRGRHRRWAQDDDPRRTAIGRLLRRTRLDELPQLVNVLLGRHVVRGPAPGAPGVRGRAGAAPSRTTPGATSCAPGSRLGPDHVRLRRQHRRRPPQAGVRPLLHPPLLARHRPVHRPAHAVAALRGAR
jgi:hypothetical protein